MQAEHSKSKFSIYQLENSGEKVRIICEQSSDGHELIIEADCMSSQKIYKGRLDDTLFDLDAVEQLIHKQRGTLQQISQDSLLLLCPPIKILFQISKESVDFKQVRLDMLERGLEATNTRIMQLESNVQYLLDRIQESPPSEQFPISFQNQQSSLNNNSEVLTKRV